MFARISEEEDYRKHAYLCAMAFIFPKQKFVYWPFTGLMCLIFLYSAWMYITNYEMVTGFFSFLGFPLWMIYPLAILKILGVIAVLSNKSRFLKEWAYAGFAFDALSAIAAHYMAGDGITLLASTAFIATLASRVCWNSTKPSTRISTFEAPKNRTHEQI